MELLLCHFPDYSSVAQIGACLWSPCVKSLHTWLSRWAFLITGPRVKLCTAGCLGGHHLSQVSSVWVSFITGLSVPNEVASEGREVEGVPVCLVFILGVLVSFYLIPSLPAVLLE